MENVYENVKKELRAEAVMDGLEMMWNGINEPENQAKIAEAKEDAGNDMIEIMKLVFPIIVDIQVEIVHKFGFSRNKDGLKEFLVRVNELCIDNVEMREKLYRLRYVYLPPYK